DLHPPSNVCCDTVHSVQAYENGRVSMTCSYNSELVNSFKYMCRGSHLSTCRQQALVTTNTQQNERFKFRQTQNRFQLQDGRSSSFSVTVAGLRETDAGTYWCGSDSQWTPGKNYTKVQLSLGQFILGIVRADLISVILNVHIYHIILTEYFKSTVSPKQTTNSSGSALNEGRSFSYLN
uniref:Immunoglobulin V-set domain-containing protein n=1 Tax=Neogobius melanostomus TaxID=47308 RepID=A0A8C6U1A0_9GOBI